MRVDFKAAIAAEISKAVSAKNPDAAAQENWAGFLETPPNPEMGDIAFPCFRLAKIFKKSPAQIAQELLGSLENAPLPFLSKAVPAGGYLNFYLDRSAYVEQALKPIAEQKEKYGSSRAGAEKIITIDYSSPNIAKHFHVGHLGTTMIGHALVNILRFLGYTVIGINYLGDWGTQFGKLITAYQKWGDKNEIERTGIDALVELYIRFHQEAEKDKSLEEEARAWLVRMQNGEEEALALWRRFGEISMTEYQRVYQRLGITFESYRGESYYNDKLDSVVQELKEKNLLTESQGAMIVDLSEHQMPPCLILRSDGGSLYPTRDIAAALDRKNTYRFTKSLYVTGMDQCLHFAQWMKVIELMGYDWAKDMVHIPYGMVVFEGGKVSTRNGHVIKMEDLLNEAAAKTLDIIEKKNPGLERKESVAEQVGLGAVIFNQLFNSRMKDVLFSWERILNFEGETGPYVQYTHARACSVLEKARQASLAEADWEPIWDQIVWSVLTDEHSYETIKILERFPDAIAEAADKYEPFLISRYLIALSQAFNKLYHYNPILTASPEEKAGRLALVFCVKTVLAAGLALLGIAAPEKM
ncbi:MAG: arginine--tRNA ligase [Clostridiales bacterium]|nr:arginine--tRNA ligase [Clostridiales bacterium]